MKIKIWSAGMILCLCFPAWVLPQTRPYRIGTTSAGFLEIGVGGAGCAMGEAYVSASRDLSSVYWNPAGLSSMKQTEVQFTYQPWLAGITLSQAGAGLVLPGWGTFCLSFTSMSYGRMGVTTLDQQDGTGETYAASDLAVGVSYARKLAQWFGFGASLKYVTSGIWHMRANAAALDLGVLVNTPFFSTDGSRENGLAIGMSISNYGSRMQYSGMDLLRPIDIAPGEAGNYKDIEGKYSLQAWELPLLFRVGVSMTPVLTAHSRILLSADALHPNNNSESINAGAEYRLSLPGASAVFLRAGYHGLFMDESVYGLTLGGGVELALIRNRILKLDYAYKSMDRLGNFSMFTIGATL
jgi:hypothetical protein